MVVVFPKSFWITAAQGQQENVQETVRNKVIILEFSMEESQVAINGYCKTGTWLFQTEICQKCNLCTG